MLSNSDYILIAIESAPTLDLEASELALALAAFDLPVEVVFRGNGVFWLLEQAARKPNGKSASKVLAAFPMYDLNKLFVSQVDLSKYSLDINNLPKSVEIVSDEKIASLFKNARHCVCF